MLINQLFRQCGIRSKIQAKIRSEFSVDDTYPISDKFAEFLKKYNNSIEITDEEQQQFFKDLNTEQSNTTKNIIYYLLIRIVIYHYQACSQQIDKISSSIEDNVRKNRPILRFKLDPKHFIGLNNSYRLFAQPNFYKIIKRFYNSSFSRYDYDIINRDIPCALNVLFLVKAVPKHHFYTTHPFQPCYSLDFPYRGLPNTKINGCKVKKNQDYYLLRRVYKQYRGDTGDRTFLAVKADLTKLIYLNPSWPASAILASKLARLISPEHFSSERLLENNFGGSRELAGFISAVDPTIRDEQRKYAGISVFSGTGIINEVQNYLGETDPNLENIGFCSKNFQTNHLMKIDFDQCVLSGFDNSMQTPFKDLLLSRSELYKTQQDKERVQQDENFIQETLYARLKLVLITEEIVAALILSYVKMESEEKNKYIEYCKNHSELCLNLFCEIKQQAEEFIQKNPTILTQCYAEMADYIEKHFKDSQVSQLLINSLEKRARTIQTELNSKLGVRLDFHEAKYNENVSLKFPRTEINAINRKASELANRNFPEASAAAQQLAKGLQQTLLFYEQKIISTDKFKQQCQEYINIAKSELEKHRGWKKLLVDLARLLGLQKIITGKAFFFTDTSQKLKQLESQVVNFGLVH